MRQNSVAEADAWAWVRVSDNGPGIASEHLPHLFDRFYRVDKARARLEENGSPYDIESGGSGLGLSIVQWVAQAHGGDISVQSEVGVGSVFEVRLPLVRSGVALQEKAGRTSAMATPHPEAITA